jgi:hypothetical protein
VYVEVILSLLIKCLVHPGMQWVMKWSFTHDYESDYESDYDLTVEFRQFCSSFLTCVDKERDIDGRQGVHLHKTW